MHEDNSFVTLTYSEQHKPADGSVEPLEIKKWMYRLREAIAPVRIRFFLVAEYGERSLRPHYHLSVFGASALMPVRKKLFQDWVHSTWSRGHVLVADFTPATAAYVSGYVVKELVDRMTPALAELRPVFTRQSLRPGLGATFMNSVAEQLATLKLNSFSIPREVRIGSKTVPLDRYCLARLRAALGLDPSEVQAAKDKESWERSLEVRFLFEEAQKAAPDKVITTTDVWKSQMDQKIIQRLKRWDIFHTERTL